MIRAAFVSIAFSIALLAAAPAAPRTWHVRPDGTGDVPNIQAAVDSARGGDLVLVAPGRYTWSNEGSGDEYAMIRFVRGRTNFTVRAEAGPELTVLDAERRGRVLYIQGGDNDQVTIEGFTFTGGQAPLFGDFYGGGLLAHLSSPVFRNCLFTANVADRGGGVYYAGVSGPRFEQCVFAGNRAGRGAAIYLVNSSLTPVFAECIIRDNTATDRGGAIYAYRFGFILENCAVFGNAGGGRGGAIYGERLLPSIVTGCTITNNRADEGSALYLFASEAQTVRRTIVALNHDGAAFLIPESALRVGCSDIFGNAGGDDLPPGAVDLGDNITLDPRFCGMSSSGDYYLRSDSPCLQENQGDEMFCGLIGAFGAACGAVAIERASWGAIKESYR